MPSSSLLAGQVAFVTGAGQGNGAAIAHGLAEAGAEVIVTDRDEHAAARTAAEIGPHTRAMRLDVTDAAECRAVAAQAGQVSILVNNAGICPRTPLDAPDLMTAWHAALDVNLTGALTLSLALLPALRASRGVIVNIASIASFVSTGTSVSYPVSKAGLRSLTQAMAQDLAKDGIRVNAIAPGPFATAMTEPTRLDPERSALFLRRIPMGRYGEPEELVGPVVFLASSMSSYVTGTTLVVDGGYLAL